MKNNNEFLINIRSEYLLYMDEEISWYSFIFSLTDYLEDGIFPSRKELDRIIYLLKLSHEEDVEPKDTDEYISQLYDWADSNKVWIYTVL